MPEAATTSKPAAWLQALRLKFYPMSWVTYSIGALAATGSSRVFASSAFWAGFAFMFFLEVATVLSNEYYDYPSDRLNRRAGPLNGGSRVLVDELLTFREMRLAIAAALLLTALAALWVVAAGRGPAPVMLLLMVLLAILALGYTVPPLRLSWRTLGELDVGVTDSIGVMLCGYVFLGGHWLDPLPWLLSLPLFLAFIPSITLCAIPDARADKAAGKRTIAVRFGPRIAIVTAQLSALLAAQTAIILYALDLVRGAYGPAIVFSALHAIILCLWLQRYGTVDDDAGIQKAIVISLAFVIWFGALPLLRLL